MESLAPYYLLSMTLNEPAFVARYRDLFLLKVLGPTATETPTGSVPPPAGVDDDEPEPSAGLEETLRDGVATLAGVRGAEWGVSVVRKRPGFQPYNRVVVGRRASGDVVLPFPSVSKVHAHFHIEEHQVRGLSDRRSTLGTMVNGRRLELDEVCPVVAGDTVRFGEVDFQLVDAARLYALLKTL